jgi:hypothetical protein
MNIQEDHRHPRHHHTQRSILLLILLVNAAMIWPARAQTNLVLGFGGSGYVTVPSADDLQNPSAITLEAWIRPVPGAGNQQTFLAKSDGGIVNSSRTYEIIWVQNGGNTGPGSRVEVNFFVGTTNWTVVGAPAEAGQWVHVAAAYDSQTGLSRLYLDGALAASTTNAADKKTPVAGQQLRQTSQPLYLGRIGYPTIFNYANGEMDEVRIWKAALTQAQIVSRMSCRLLGSEADLVAYWNFDDGIANDVTGRGHNGSFTGNVGIGSITGVDVVHQGGCGGGPFNFDLSRLRYSSIHGYRLKLTGPSATRVTVQSSSDLLTWTNVITFMDINDEVDFFDQAAAPFAHQFYRTVTP